MGHACLLRSDLISDDTGRSAPARETILTLNAGCSSEMNRGSDEHDFRFVGVDRLIYSDRR